MTENSNINMSSAESTATRLLETNGCSAQQSPSKLLRRRVMGERQPFKQVSESLMRRLQLESQLSGHTGCVNCLEWNLDGTILASGSDDRNVILWDPFKRLKLRVIKTGHLGNIFSVKFLEQRGSLVATGASDCGVKLINTYANEIVLNCKSCHENRVKRLAVHPAEPQLIWSAGEDGYIMQYDIRERHTCSDAPRNLLIDLSQSLGKKLAAKCIAINPIQADMLAVGANDAYVRLYDRRFLPSSTAYFMPAHLTPTFCNLSNETASAEQRLHHRSPSFIGTTYLSFSPDGSELLANMHAEQVYLFNTREPGIRRKLFEVNPREDSEQTMMNKQATIERSRQQRQNQQQQHIRENYLSSSCSSRRDLLIKQQNLTSTATYDHTKSYSGHCNINTDIKEANFFGDFIVAGSDDGAFFIWDKKTTNIVKAVQGDMQILNCLQPHPSICMLATSGVEPLVKLWSPTGKTCHDVQSLESRCNQNREYINSDPLEAMMMMLLPTTRAL